MTHSFEHTVLAYLDGALDPREEAAFLRDVAGSPEKQAILQQFRQLDAAMQRLEFTEDIPAQTEHALAERIPSLRRVAGQRPLAETVTHTAVRSARLSKTTLSLLIFGGLFIVSLLFLLPDLPESFSSGSNHARPQPRSAPATPAATGADEAAAASGAMQEMSPTTAAVSSSSAAPAPGAAKGRTLEKAPAFIADSRTAGPSQTDLRAAAGDNSVTEKRSASHIGAPVAIITAIPLRPMEAAFGKDGSRHQRMGGPAPQGRMELLTGGRLFLFLESGAAHQEMQGSGTRATTMLRGVYLAGLRYAITPRITAGMDVGRSLFSREAAVGARTSLDKTIETEMLRMRTTLNDEMLPWFRLHGSYTINPEDMLHVQADMGAGMTLDPERDIMFSAGLSALYLVNYNLRARAGLHFTGTWLRAVPSVPFAELADDRPLGIIDSDSAPGTVFSSAMELRIGIGILLW